MRPEVEITVTAEDRARLAAITADRNTPQKHVWRAQIILSGDGLVTMAIMRQTGRSKPYVWRWQARFMACTGNPVQVCGGRNSNTVYATGR